MNLREATMKYSCLVVFIRHLPLRYWGLGVDSQLALVL
jgi:hypothetical protein